MKLQTRNEEKLVLCLERMCNQIQNPPSPQGSAVFDFSGTGTEVWGNCNAPRAITLSALIYCLRCMVGQDIPLNQVVRFLRKVKSDESSVTHQIS